MRLLGLDLETTGRDTKVDRVTEIGLVLWCTKIRGPILIQNKFLYDKTYPTLSKEINEITGITDSLLQEFGCDPKFSFNWFIDFLFSYRPSYIVSHNGLSFDRPLLLSELERNQIQSPSFEKTPWIDTLNDIEFLKEPDSKKLKYMAADHGFLNPFCHRALGDILSTMKILDNYDIDKVIAYSQIPSIVVAANVKYIDRHLAKERKFHWQEAGGKLFDGKWVKKIKENKLEEERSRCPFPIDVVG